MPHPATLLSPLCPIAGPDSHRSGISHSRRSRWTRHQGAGTGAQIPDRPTATRRSRLPATLRSPLPIVLESAVYYSQKTRHPKSALSVTHRSEAAGWLAPNAWLLSLCAALCLALCSGNVQAIGFDVRVVVWELTARASFDDFDGTDFMAIVNFNGVNVSNEDTPGQDLLEDRDNIQPQLLNAEKTDWQIKRSFDPSVGSVNIKIFIQDEDDNPNDVVDVFAGAGVGIDLDLNLQTCGITGAFTGVCGDRFTSSGDGDGDGDADFEFSVEIIGFNQGAGNQVFCTHDPIWPQAGESVTITAVSLSDELTPKSAGNITISDDQGVVLQSDSPAVFSTTTVTPTDSFTYSCSVSASGGVVAFTPLRTFSVGPPPSGRAVPVMMVSDDPTTVRDVLLIPDSGTYTGATDNQFIQDAKNAIDLYYLSGPVFLARQDMVNFWIAQDTGVAGGSDGENCNRTPPANLAQSYAFSNGSFILHRRNIRDCSQFGVAISKAAPFDDDDEVFLPFEPAVGITPFVHELGHALYGLADEYCDTRDDALKSCDGGYFMTAENPNVFTSSAACEAINPVGGPGEPAGPLCDSWESEAERTDGDTFFTFDPAVGDLMTDNFLPRFLDVRRINGVLDDCSSGC